MSVMLVVLGLAVLATISFEVGRWQERNRIEEQILFGRCDACNVSWVLWERDEPCPQCGGALHYREHFAFSPPRLKS